MEIIANEAGEINIKMLTTVYSWSRAWSITKIDLKVDAIYEWVFEINNADGLCIGIGDGCNQWFYLTKGGAACNVIKDFKDSISIRYWDGDIMKMEFGLINETESEKVYNEH